MPFLKGHKSGMTGKQHSRVTREKISNAQRGEKNHAWGKKITEEHKRKISIALKGRKMSAEHKKKISKNNSRYWSSHSYPESARKKLRLIAKKRGFGKWMLGRKLPEIVKRKMGRKDTNHHAWRGDNAGYRAKHTWIQGKRGQPTICEHCGTAGLKGHQIHWANVSGKYKREFDDWLRLCAKCHKIYDLHENL